MKILTALLLMLIPFTGTAQNKPSQPFQKCGVEGSTTLYHLEGDSWTFTDSLDAQRETLPASTFKILNSAIALETGAVADEHEVFEWDGTENTFFGTRIEAWNRDIDMETAFKTSAIWFYEVLARQIGRDTYHHWLDSVDYGNGNLTEPGDDFWNFGNFGITPVQQIHFLKGLYTEEFPLSAGTYQSVKNLLITEVTETYTLSGKTGWTKTETEDIGWWIGYIERSENTWFFATRITNNLLNENPGFSSCRTDITHSIFKELGIL